jgi:uncharacterized protein (DUF2141 family)
MKVLSHRLQPRQAPAHAVSIVAACALLSALAIVAAPAQAQSPAVGGSCIAVEVQNVRAEQGPIMVAAYDSEATFRKTAKAAMQLRADAATLSFPLCGLGGGSVALTLYQDLNGNGKLDSNAFGMPTEPWGASGKPVPMSAPTWDSAAVPIDGGTVVVKLSQ